MPDITEGGAKEFASFLKGVKSIDELKSGAHTVLRGTVYRSGEGTFALVTGTGESVELDVAAVDRFRVVGSGLQPEIEISIATDALKNAKSVNLKYIPADTTNYGLDHKPPAKDIRTDPIVDHTWFVHDKHTKEIAKDPIYDPVKGFADPIDPGAAVNPPYGAQGGAMGMSPFVLATPHQAPAPMVNMQMMGQVPWGPRAGGAHKPIETIKELSWDHTLKELIQDPTFKEPIQDPTYKELIQDPTYKEVPYDTYKELIETLAEGGGTWAEGGGTLAEVGGGGTLAEGGPFPGGFPGMPGF